MRLFILLSLCVFALGYQDIDCATIPGLNTTIGLDFSAWDHLMKTYVYGGKINNINLNEVDYVGVANDTKLAYFKCQVENTQFLELNWTLHEWNAFWINAYNFGAVYTVVTNPCRKSLNGKDCSPIESIRDVGEVQPSPIKDAVWDRPLMKIGGVEHSLNDIEHVRLRAGILKDETTINNWIEDPRLHACIVCASVSCPNLRAEAYSANLTVLDHQMSNNTIEFLANPKKGSTMYEFKVIFNDSEKNTLYLSPIFNWFQGDFQKDTSTYHSLAAFLQAYGPSDVAEYAKKHSKLVDELAPRSKSGVAYFLYDWNLNGEVGALCGVNGVCLSLWVIFPAAGIFVLIVTVIILIVICTKKRNEAYEKIN